MNYREETYLLNTVKELKKIEDENNRMLKFIIRYINTNISKASNEEIFLFRKALFNSYKDDLYSEHWKDDLDKLKALKDDLESDQWEGIIQKKNINWIIQDIQRLIDKFTAENKE